ncbi:MAG: DUF5615 family PIN-like protein [Patescibacteria group bacterium]
MRTKKPKQKKFPKFRLLLDSAFAKPYVFKKTIKKTSIRHIRHDFNLSPETEDQEIYSLASKKEMFVVTLDLGFRKLTKQNAAGVLILSSGLSNEEIDDKLSIFISGKNPQDYKGKTTKI